MSCVETREFVGTVVKSSFEEQVLRRLDKIERELEALRRERRTMPYTPYIPPQRPGGWYPDYWYSNDSRQDNEPPKMY